MDVVGFFVDAPFRVLAAGFCIVDLVAAILSQTMREREFDYLELSLTGCNVASVNLENHEIQLTMTFI